MTVTAVTIPTPPNSNEAYSMFVWINSVGGTTDVLNTDANMQSLLNFCSSNGVNVLFMDIWAYLGGGNFTTAHAQSYQKFIHFAHASGIRVYALAGNNDWQHNQQWVFGNIVKNIAQYNTYCASNATNTFGQFDGVILDAEYWTQAGGYTSTDVIGMCDLIKGMKSALNMPVGFTPTVWLADPTSAALTVTYDGYTGLEGQVLMQVADFCAVQNYYNNSTTQINTFDNWFNFASQTGLGYNFGLYCTSLTDSGFGTQSYYTGSAGAKATMTTAQTAVSTAFTASPNTNACFLGNCVEQYNSYKSMT
jgi:hypothetical protein